jgi:hypothetical protein
VDCLFDPPGRELRQRVRAQVVAILANPEAKPKVTVVPRRLGWAVDRLLRVLADAGQPLAVVEIVRRIRERYDEPIAHATVMHVLRRGREAKAGRIVQTGPGEYALAGRCP